MKKAMVGILAFVMLFTATACSDGTGSQISSDSPGQGTSASNTEQTPATDSEITLQYSMPLPVTHQFIGYDEEWIARVSELTNGTLAINPHWAGAVVPMTS